MVQVRCLPSRATTSPTVADSIIPRAPVITTTGNVTLGGQTEGLSLFGSLDTGASWKVDGTFSAGGAGAANFAMSGGILTTGNATIDARGNVSLDDGDVADGAIWHVNGTLTVGSSTSGTTARLSIFNHSKLDAAAVSVTQRGVLQITDAVYAGAVTVSGGRITGNGTVGSLSVSGGGMVDPKDFFTRSVAALNVTGDVEMGAGSVFQFDITAATGTAGTDWDLLTVGNQLTFSSTTGDPFTLQLLGSPGDFDPDQSYRWDFITANTVVGFDGDAVAIDLTGFYNSYTGVFSVIQDDGTITLVYTAAAIPEPATYAELFGLVVLGFAFWRRKENA